MAYIHTYKGTVTSGGTNGTLVSEGDGSAPITTAVLNATTNEVGAWILCALRCESGYKTSGNTTVTPTGTTASKWQLAAWTTGDTTAPAATPSSYGAVLTVTSVIDATNTLYWARAKATSDENPANDTSVDLVVAATIVAQ